jgi:uncharacterized SAM-binding protein YcdF (DUF218 family)
VFLWLSKVLDVFLAPLTWAVVLGLLALLGVARRPARSRLLLGLALLDLLAFSLEPVSRSLFDRLEAGAVSTFHPDPPYDVVVVLGGMIDPVAMERSHELELNEAADRISRAAILLRAGQARMVLLSGGLIDPPPGVPGEAASLAGWLRDQGIEPDRIVVEGRSRNTRENAVESAAIIAAHGWQRVLLVTSAWHAPRALGCFRAVGLSPDLLPVDHRGGTPTGPAAWLPRAGALSGSTDALREAFGRLVYRAVGYAR